MITGRNEADERTDGNQLGVELRKDWTETGDQGGRGGEANNSTQQPICRSSATRTG